jgi:hypothetical protein
MFRGAAGEITPRQLAVASALAVLLGFAPVLAADVDFARDVLPILSDNCFQCHGPDAQTRQADLRLDLKEVALRAESPVIVPGESANSELIRRLSADEDERMPPPSTKKRLSVAQIDVLRRWIDQGARWGKHWSYEPVRRPALPAVQAAAWPRNPIDVFILARLEREGLSPSPEANKETFIRRLSLDLTGLPPEPDQIDEFLVDNSAGAYERLVDRLLASPRYGERMAWDWLDAARYADSNGFQGDPERTMWPWRDWVIEALNANLPYDQFTIEQLAGDLLPDASPRQKLATGFNRNHMHNGEGGRIAEETRVENVFDRAETTATVWLGITLTCCRCHDHKFDPFTARDYYGLYAYFNNTSEDGNGRSGQNAPAMAVPTSEMQDRSEQLRRQLQLAAEAVEELERQLSEIQQQKADDGTEAPAEPPQEVRDALKAAPEKRDAKALDRLIDYFKDRQPDYAARLKALKAAGDQRAAHERSIPRVMIMDELARPRETFILTRGAYNQPGEKVAAALPAALPPLPAGAPNNRLGLARWLVASENPLTARVTVNRFWQTFFGMGLVKTSEDFGVQGERPSHPDLLEWMAADFVASGWDVKRLHRMIVTSATYRQTSTVSPRLLERDPENRLLARGGRYRLPSWMLRDQALAAAGLLSPQLGGPPVKPYQPAGIWEEATFGKKSYVQDHSESLYRRSLYIFWRRIVGPTMFFDTSARQVCSVKPSRTNTPLHALTLLNDMTYVEAARVMAQRVLTRRGIGEHSVVGNTQSPGAPADLARLDEALRLVVSRRPSLHERQLLASALGQLRQQYAGDEAAARRLLAVGERPRDESLDTVEHAAWTGLCLLLLNLDEALTRE